LVADTVSGLKTLDQNSGSQRPKFRQELSKPAAQEERIVMIL